MPIIHNETRERYTCIDNDALQTSTLSLKARGMLATLLSLPQDWSFNQQGLVNLCSDGLTAVRSALDELEELGYLDRSRVRDDAGRLGEAVWTVREKPISGKPTSVNPISEYRILDTLKLQSNKEQSNKLQSTNKILSGKPDCLPLKVSEILDYLNAKLGTSYRPSSRKTTSLVNARLKEGFTVDDFKTVIDKKCAAWMDDPKMSKYLRPETLFGTKFEGYLNERTANDRRRAIDERFAKFKD